MRGEVGCVRVGTNHQALQIPIDAVSRLEDMQYIYVVREGKAQRVDVEIGARSASRVELIKGLTGDEHVLVSSKGLVHDGTPVQILSLPQS